MIKTYFWKKSALSFVIAVFFTSPALATGISTANDVTPEVVRKPLIAGTRCGLEETIPLMSILATPITIRQIPVTRLWVVID